MTLEGQVAVITGAARGLGRAYALLLAKLGADIVINDINMESAKEYPEELTADTVMDEVRALGRRSIGIEGDVADQATVDAIFEQTLAEFGKVDILVANAGGMRGDRTESHAAAGTERNMRANLDSNLMGTVLCCQAASVPMKERNYGRIVTVYTGRPKRPSSATRGTWQESSPPSESGSTASRRAISTPGAWPSGITGTKRRAGSPS
jgi:NAD(P)-dependent dehydrogenase (short-subunit alcohol dehydrogenase family)